MRETKKKTKRTSCLNGNEIKSKTNSMFYYNIRHQNGKYARPIHFTALRATLFVNCNLFIQYQRFDHKIYRWTWRFFVAIRVDRQMSRILSFRKLNFSQNERREFTVPCAAYNTIISMISNLAFKIIMIGQKLFATIFNRIRHAT